MTAAVQPNSAEGFGTGSLPRSDVQPPIVRVFVRLKWSLLRNGLRQSSGRTALFVVSGVLVLLVAALVLLGMVALRGRPDAAALGIVLVAVLTLGWAVMPLFAGGGDETLDPGRLAMLPLRPRPLLTALLVSGLVGFGPLFTLVIATGAAVSVADGAGWAAAVVAVPLVVLVCVALSRALATANARLLTSRKGRDLALLSGLFLAVGIQLVNLAAQQLGAGGGLAALRPYADVLRWLPPASGVEAVRAAGEGSYALAALLLAATAGVLAALLWWWHAGLTKMMTAPDSSTLQPAPEADRGRAGGGRLSALLPAGRTGPALRRTLQYAWRDPRTKAAWATSLGIGVLLPFVTAVQGNGSVYNACWVAGMLGLLMYNQFGQDSSAFWMVAGTISSSRDAYLELRARALALAVVVVPFTVVVLVGSAAVFGQWDELPSALGLALALAGVLIGGGAVASALFPYSIPQDSGYKNVVPGQGSVAYMSLLLGLLAGLLLCLPVVALTVWMHLDDRHGMLWTVLPVGIGYGLLVAVAGLKLAAPRTARRLPEILTAVSKG
ncbi:transporter [Streptomyces sp. 549]|uniref:transporter n=1 Tax=Streptomyces sp. 549 TaxID=3049076 RepID=UPI0024C42794|nr:transporter [Streptomyces sp. 549]MDK1472556.1 transporter [Streptomyces sp. 549]